MAGIQGSTSVSLVARSLSRSRLNGVVFREISGQPVPAPAMLVWNPRFMPPVLEPFIGCAARLLQASA